MPKRVLIVDDETGIRKVIEILLKEMANWDVLVAASGQEGLAIAQAEFPDAILLDVMMPDMDGIQTLGHLQDNPTTQAIPVILLTAKVQILQPTQFVELPIAGIITKPFAAPDLVQQIRSFLDW